jgi:hypothetical protein
MPCCVAAAVAFFAAAFAPTLPATFIAALATNGIALNAIIKPPFRD